jgi:hypothetical protein
MTGEDLDSLADDTDPSYFYGTIALVFALICFVLPLRSLLDFIVGSEDADEDKPYKSVCHTFSSDYDR